LLIAFVLLLAPSPASAQFSAAIQGTIVDSQGLVLPGAIVRITNVTTGVQREVVTTPDGVYRAPSLAAGTYRIEVELSHISGIPLIRRSRSVSTSGTG
jgi:hypothetical protein